MDPSEAKASLTVREAAIFLGAHIETVRRLARRGAIPSFKVGKDWRFRREALLRWAEGKSEVPRAERVVIVDDDEVVCRALAQIVEGCGCEAVTSTDARRALGLVAESETALVMLDLRMPAMNGPQFLSELRKTHPNLPVVIVTGHPDGVLMHEAAQHPPLMLLAKPFETSQVRQTVLAVLGAQGTRASPHSG